MTDTARGQTESSSKEPSAGKQLEAPLPPDWCVDCGALAEDRCSGHRLLEREVAWQRAQARLSAALAASAAAQAAQTAAQRQVARQQAHLDALARARALASPVLQARVAECDGSKGGWWVLGGDITIAVAATEDLTADDAEAVCAALEELCFEYQVDNYDTDSTLAYGDTVLCALDAILAKLPDCVEGQAARKGDVLLDAEGQLQVFFADVPSRGGPGVKMFGRVKSGLDCLEGRGCDAESNWEGPECWTGPVFFCFCREREAGSTTLSSVQFEA